MTYRTEEAPEVIGWQTVSAVHWDSYTSPSGGTLSRFPFLSVGDRVRCRKAESDPWQEGTIKLFWFGIEEVIDVVHDDGERRSWYPDCGLGEEMQRRILHA